MDIPIKKMSPEIYVRRRMLVGMAGVAVVMAIIFSIQALTSHSAQLATGDDVVEVLTTNSSLVSGSTVPPQTMTTIEIMGPPRVSIYGDSLAAGFGNTLKSTLDRQGVTTFLATHGSSGLSQPGFFDWPNHLNVWVPQEDADVVVIGLGANDGQDVYADNVSYSVSEPQWSIEYARRVTEIITLVTSQGRSLVWVGTPDAKLKGMRSNLSTLRAATKQAITVAHDSGLDVVYVDTWMLFLGLDGMYSAYVIDPSDGERKKSRDSDGFHLSLVGNKILSAVITSEVEAALDRRVAQ